MPKAILAVSLIALLFLGSPARAQDEPATPDAVKAKIAALDVDGAKKLLDRLRSESKGTPTKELEKELAIARKIEPVQKKQLKLLDDARPRESYEVALAAADQFPGALALQALAPRMKEARRLAFLVVDDFDGPELKVGASVEAAGGQSKNLGKASVCDSKAEAIADPVGGAALRWLAATGTKLQDIEWGMGQVDLAEYEYVSLRLRVPKVPSDTVYLRIRNNYKNSNDRAVVQLALKPDPAWHEVRVPLKGLETKGAFDPTKAALIGLHYQGVKPLELSIDDLMLARKDKK